VYIRHTLLTDDTPHRASSVMDERRSFDISSQLHDHPCASIQSSIGQYQGRKLRKANLFFIYSFVHFRFYLTSIYIKVKPTSDLILLLHNPTMTFRSDDCLIVLPIVTLTIPSQHCWEQRSNAAKRTICSGFSKNNSRPQCTRSIVNLLNILTQYNGQLNWTINCKPNRSSQSIGHLHWTSSNYQLSLSSF